MKLQTKYGFTLLEIILVVAVILIIATIVVESYSLFNARVSLKGDVGKIASLLYQAKSDTISGKGGLQYGVHFESGKVVLFQGDSYSAGATTNEEYPLGANISISVIALTGGGSEIVFHKLTGVTDESGSVTVRMDGVGTAISVISISNNGIVTVQ